MRWSPLCPVILLILFEWDRRNQMQEIRMKSSLSWEEKYNTFVQPNFNTSLKEQDKTFKVLNENTNSSFITAFYYSKCDTMYSMIHYCIILQYIVVRYNIQLCTNKRISQGSGIVLSEWRGKVGEKMLETPLLLLPAFSDFCCGF